MPDEREKERRDAHERGEREVFRDVDGRSAGISWLRLRRQWSAWVREGDGFRHEICDTHKEAVEALRRDGAWEGLPDA